jgi:predicted ArsR family transcriptional regulator
LFRQLLCLLEQEVHVALSDADDHLTRVAALGEPVRRALYRFVAAQPEPVSRERAATGVGVAHHVAKFHLDRLEADGLLEVEYARPPGRAGPGAGRPAKLYRRSSRHIAVSLPERRYDLAGRILAEAVTAAQRSGVPLDRSLREAAGAVGRAVGEQAPSGATPSGVADPLDAVSTVLAGIGYEPRVDADCIVLGNCPFHSLAENYTALVCGMNLDLITGILSVLPQCDANARLDPAPGRCCVKVHR